MPKLRTANCILRANPEWPWYKCRLETYNNEDLHGFKKLDGVFNIKIQGCGLKPT